MGVWHYGGMATKDSMEGLKYYAEALTRWDRVNAAYQRDEASREELDAAWEMRKSAFENLQRLEQAAAAERSPS